MKLLGAGLLWTSLIYAGVIYSIKLNKRVVLLEKTLVMFEEMKIMIEYLNMPVGEMLLKISEKGYLESLTFIKSCSNEIISGADFPVAWKNSLSLHGLLYKTQETDKLLQLGENLGTSDKENQMNILNMQTSYFNEYLQTATDKKKKYSSMSSAIGVLVGCMIFIMTI